ncbi:MAG TPA: menaquinone biosynthesis protein [Puia sp.]|nr:menaquinone biosynthesis protein [Puia sp.]
MDRKIRVGAVSYLNTKPLLYGIQSGTLINDITLKIDYPSKIAELLLKDEIDIGLVPVAIIPGMKEYHINTNYCIASDGAIASVCIFSESPIEKIETVLLDYQSRTSVILAKILLKEYWKIHPQLIDGGEDFIKDIKGNTAGVVIGDRALEQRKKSAYIYDLGEAWKSLTGLPFVFAAWVSNKKLDDSFVNQFDQANGIGIHHIEDVLAGLNYNGFDLHEYYTHFIKYEFDDKKRKGLDLFLQKLKTLH